MTPLLLFVCVVDGLALIGLAAIGIDMIRMHRRWRREDHR